MSIAKTIVAAAIAMVRSRSLFLNKVGSVSFSNKVRPQIPN